MKQVSKYLAFVICFVMFMTLISCKRGPAKLEFYNQKNVNYMSHYYFSNSNQEIYKNNKPFSDYYVQCDKGITTKPGIMFGAELNKQVGDTKATLQIIESYGGGVLSSEEMNINPELEGLSTWANLPKQTKYKINIIVKGEIIAQGEIEYK